jgi:hypothetical protein
MEQRSHPLFVLILVGENDTSRLEAQFSSDRVRTLVKPISAIDMQMA